MQAVWIDVRDAPATAAGWYATVSCWDPHEGLFPGAHYWNGRQWAHGPAIVRRSPHPFETEASATQYARDHDPERL
jgi:hypothetical protein